MRRCVRHDRNIKKRAEGILYIRDRMDFHGSIFLFVFNLYFVANNLILRNTVSFLFPE